jgi:hypothetical protein
MKGHDEPKGWWSPDRGWASQHDQGGYGGSARGREGGTREGALGGDGYRRE